MAPRVLLQLVFFLLPFIMFGLYRLAIAEAKEEGRKPWPIRVLFGIGFVLAIGSWIAFIFIDQTAGREECYRASFTDPATGEFVPGERYACEKDFEQIGVPRSMDPGGKAIGVGEPDPAGPEGAVPGKNTAPDVEPIVIDENTAETLDDSER